MSHSWSLARFLVSREPSRQLIYQRYYLSGLATRVPVRIDGGLPVLRLVPGATRQLDTLIGLAVLRRRLSLRPLPEDYTATGRYVLEADGTSLRIVVDAADNHKILDEPSLAWADVYFKANRWPDIQYEDKVVPIVNGNGILNRRRLSFLRSQRGAAKDTDVAFVANVWGGRDHVVRIFEELARLDCKTRLLAIFPDHSSTWDGETAQLAARLDKAGVRHTKRQMRPRELWRILARSRLAFIRSGRHLCIPWRMIDLLCMGACPLFDAEPIPRWPVPLRSGIHYLSCGIDRPPWSPPDPGEYAKIAPAVERALEDPDGLATIRVNTARYFDEHAAPQHVADWILNRCAARLT